MVFEFLIGTDELMNLRVAFRFKRLEADTIKIVCTDTGNLTAVYLGPFPGSAPFILDDLIDLGLPQAVLPLSISGVGAIAGAVMILLNRIKANKMAKLLENTISGR